MELVKDVSSVLPLPFTPYKYPRTRLHSNPLSSTKNLSDSPFKVSCNLPIQNHLFINHLHRSPPVEMEEAGHRCCVAEEQSQTAVSHQPIKKCGSDATLSAADGCFDCNICLDYAVEPVVTLCGHLYCWPCIYKWLQSASSQQCPVCKAALSQTSLVPLYGRGDTTKVSTQGVPRRPPSAPRELPREPLPPMEHVSPQLLRMPMLHYATGGALGGMAIAVLPWVMRNHGVYNTSPPRVRRQEMQVERSLHQIWVFSLCCALLCLLLF